jgi:tetrahydromethanopterin S-methyltransferase subunit G
MRMGLAERNVVSLQVADATQNVEIDRIEERLDRIERRLELTGG